MAGMVKVDVVCPCGKLLRTTTVSANSSSTSRGTLYCSGCRKNVQYAIRGTNAYTNYKQ